MGDTSLLIQCGDSLRSRGHDIALVISANSAIDEWARANGIDTVSPETRFADAVAASAFDWFFSIGNLRLIPGPVWRQARKGAVNFHDGPLPAYAGLNTPAWAILAGEPRHGVTWHALADSVDTGDIYAQHTFEIGEGETSLSLNAKCFEAGIESFSELLEKIETGNLTGTPQDFTLRTYYSKNARPDNFATIDFRASAKEIDRLARALNFGPGYANTLALPKLWTRAGAKNVTGVEVAMLAQPLPPGTVASVETNGAVVATADGAIRILGLCDENGKALDLATALSVGDVLPQLDKNAERDLHELSGEIARHEDYFIDKLADLRQPEIQGLQPASDPAPHWERLRLATPADLCGNRAIAALGGGLVRVTNQARFELAVTDDTLAELVHRHPGYVAPSVPLSITTDDTTTVDQISETVAADLETLRSRRAYAGDLAARYPQIATSASNIAVRRTAGEAQFVEATPGAALTFIVPETSGKTIDVIIDSKRLSRTDAELLLAQLSAAMVAFSVEGNRRLHDLPVMSADTERALITERNNTVLNYDRTALIHQLIEAQVEKTPDATAVICEGRSLTYRELDREANQLANRLIALGTCPDTLVGLYLNRSCELVIGALAILKSGAAYVPLDPAYPRDRIAMIIEDSGLDIVLTDTKHAREMPAPSARIITVDGHGPEATTERPTSDVKSDNLAYVIYTSGSTGRPKGVMVEHRNVANFFAGMNERVPVPTDRQPVWLAVTSLSFDISVLELFWTLTHGFAVVVHVDDKHADQRLSHRPRRAQSAGDMDFSLYYWGNNDGAGPGAYQLLLDGARFADTHGFAAVWMPERHFHAFGGPYPNPSVTGAAVAAITSNVEIRAGSCVLPLHHPARVAEEWAVIDNLSNGRTGLAFASGWMPEDFVLRPENAPPANKAALLRDIDIVRRLWRGESVRFPAQSGKEVDIVTQPRPISGELKVWVTSAGNPDTYREAARLGANVLTHLLGHSIAELAEKIKIYRETLEETGRNPADHKVTLMLHTLVGEDREQVRDIAREPMKNYLRSAAALIKQYAWAFPAFKKPQGVSDHAELDLRSLSAEELDAVIEFAFLRYFDDSGFFGTVDDALARVEQLKAIGVDEIACLIDFGVPTKTVLNNLQTLAKVVSAVNPRGAVEEEEIADYSIAGLIRRHGVTHLQCTPAMATMLLMDDQNRQALGGIRHLFIGGEALTGTLLRDLRRVTAAPVENMYGPTETTVWSSTGPASDTESAVPLGTPIANTQLYILDDKQRLVLPGVTGELYIGGDGVTRGYLNREELTRERFLANPFMPEDRMYRTGDLVRVLPDGSIQFIGRTDHQVKVRGYRIELGEIEARIGNHPAVQEAVVIVREDRANDARIVAYIRYKSAAPSDEELRAHIHSTLPEFMVPAHFVAMESFPLTPNAKVDRKALPAPGMAAKVVDKRLEFVAPEGDLQLRIADAFKRILRIETVGVNDNFFTLGGHSLLAVQVHRDLKANVAPDISITDIYRFPTVAGLAGHLSDRGQANKSLSEVADRAAMRRRAMADRRPIATRARETT
ncbi:MupA/Atu3671 family FMN-dependent luciferase-like monooxygenase [Hyphomicrobium sp.]|uniref:MupA/Atu3671 family FMN-dependent luciferase-like monooxygenase n=1 Tax=Hyphomicrobium sp. TaxID=82 RepID=UPI002E31B894|nr:MupA/Atu3671 family FMN-dependent luciferase-like monooxygenase [Hyphomicrobium sp.]HEX2842511.1 MupA/Atu3671 family FMN-dependent luciferase-like monooxygenase [Hyphomicrobium sp.]